MTNRNKKRIVLFLLFILPLFLYLFLSSGINNFAKLPVLSNNITDVSLIDDNKTTTLNGKISIICFLGNDIEKAKGGLFNLNQKIYKPFYGFKDFQIIALYPEEKQKEVLELKADIAAFTDMVKWKFIASSEAEIKALYDSFKTNTSLYSGYSSKAYLVDKEAALRGRIDDEDEKDGKLYGYDMTSVAVLNNKMKDDVKVVLAEYRLALKKNNADREI
ncbi:hypothetical protein DUT90_00785 [Polaribacter sp. WD7]|uniref:hypothetical protein n=1 Tax=Polaribacter sp. WD7 TaxID=2269061 RepID=UPI000DF2CE5F|nr:hypothetical protein [Polaribacter sp. WD7]RCS28359.1 hypothetical protein DUT90_00785 [Polaribacter sp. WD7]